MTTLINKEIFPKKEEIFSWIVDLTQWGHRKTGTPEGRKSAEYIAGKLNEFGMENIKIEEVPSMCMFVNDCKLNIDNEDIECFYANGTNRGAEKGVFSVGKDDSKDEFVFLGDGLEADFENIDVEGKIVVCSVRFLKAGSVAASFDKVDVYDPKGKLKKARNKTDIYSPNNWPSNYYYALQKGAKGFVGILEDYMDDPYWYCEDYTDIGRSMGIEFMSIPGIWISRSTGKLLKEKFAKQSILSGKVIMESKYDYADALNISGILPGISDDVIVVHSHHDAVFEGAVQDASGISEMLALGKYFSQLPKEERKKTMMFVATDTHYTDYMGHQAFVKARQDEGMNMILDIAIEHIAKEAVFNDDGDLVETGEVEDRLIYVTRESGLYDDVFGSFAKYDLEKTMFVTTGVGKGLGVTEYEFHQDEIISDAYYFNEGGTPVVSMVCGPQYLFHPSDRPDRIPLDQLEPVGMAFTEIALIAAEKL